MAPKKSNSASAKYGEGDSTPKFLPVKFTRMPTNIEAQPIFMDHYLFIATPFAEIIKELKMATWIGMSEPTCPGLVREFYASLKHLGDSL